MNSLRHPQYDEQDHETWRSFYREFGAHKESFQSIIHPFYANNEGVLASLADRVPTKAQIDEILTPIGWSVQYVEGFVPIWMVADILSKKRLPIASKLRGKDEVFFASEPDLIHDIFGHLPSLFNAEYRGLLEKWAKKTMNLPITELDRCTYHLNKSIMRAEQRAKQSKSAMPRQSLKDLKRGAESLKRCLTQNPSPAYLAEKAYFWIFEFGIVAGSKPKVFGAGLISSMNEMKKISLLDFPFAPLSTTNLCNTSHVSQMQDSYLVARDLSVFSSVIDVLTRPTLASEGHYFYG